MDTYDNPLHLLHDLRLEKNEAFEHLYRKHYRSVSNFIRFNSGTENDARDVFQETLLALCKNIRLETFHLDRHDIGAYLFAIAKNCWLYRLRSQKSKPEFATSENRLSDVPANEDPASEHFEEEREEKRLALTELLAAMNPACREILHGFYFLRQSLLQLAQSLGYSEDYIKLKKHRCMKDLREKIDHHPAFRHE